jgi:hypothetical protein
MLTVQALYSWDDPAAISLRTSRPFTAIYVPTDMHWHHQLRHGESQLSKLSPEVSLAVSRCAVTTSILLAVVKTFQARVRYEGVQESNEEELVAKELIKSWMLEKTLPRFEVVALALKNRISKIRAFINALTSQTHFSGVPIQIPEYFHLDYFAAMDHACSAFDLYFNMPQSNKWALCLDEMELAPDWLQSLAFSQVRSSDQSYLIKLSTSPIPSVSGDTGAQPRQDFQLISIWNHTGRDSESFAEQLSNSILKRRYGKNITADSIMGKSRIVPSNDFETAKYERGSFEWNLFKDLASWDPSFRKLLHNSAIDPDDPVCELIATRDAILRKAKPIAMFRAAFLKMRHDGKIWFRSRKSSGGVYCGTKAVYRISDGNPRRLIGIINDLLARVQTNGDGQPIPLSENEQDDVLNKASSQFLGYVNALPGGSAKLGAERLDLATVLKAIATYFRQSMLGDEFTLDPKGSFIVDSKLNPQLVELIRLGVYHGAIVHVDPLPDTIETSVVGKRFRLSYMLAPTTRLPLMLYASVSLATILRASNRLRIRKASVSIEQIELPI